MSTDREMTRIVRSWLEEGATALPDRVLDAVLDQVPATPQRRAWWPARRSTDLNNMVKLLIAAAAVVAIAVIGLNVLPRGGGIGGPGPTPSPSPAATPTPAPTPIPLSAADTNRILPPGTYGVGPTFSSPFSITTDAGWMANTLRTGEAQFSRDASVGAPGGISVEIVNGVFPDPCHTDSGPTGSPATSTVDGLVGLLTGMTGFEAGPVTDAQISGHPAKTFTLTNAIKTDTAGCSGGPMLWLWTAKGSVDNVGTNGGAAQQIWVVDVSGTPVVIVGEGGPASDPASGSTRTIVESIKFQ